MGSRSLSRSVLGDFVRVVGAFAVLTADRGRRDLGSRPSAHEGDRRRLVAWTRIEAFRSSASFDALKIPRPVASLAHLGTYKPLIGDSKAVPWPRGEDSQARGAFLGRRCSVDGRIRYEDCFMFKNAYLRTIHFNATAHHGLFGANLVSITDASCRCSRRISVASIPHVHYGNNTKSWDETSNKSAACATRFTRL